MSDTGAPSKVETIKIASRNLRAGIGEELSQPTALFAEDHVQLLKFHGTYQQYDRDSATERKNRGLDKEHQFMLRIRIPGGRLSAEQYLAINDLADRFANGTLRITTREAIQLHGILKHDLKATIAHVNRVLLTTLGACGDIVRNVTTNAAPIANAVHRRLEADATILSRDLLPKTRAYHEIWLDGEKLDLGAEPEHEPLYGRTYLPRKFKIGIGTPEDNSVDVLTNDLACIALFEGENLIGYNLAVGGGLGTTHNKPETYPRLATPIAFVGPDDLVRAAECVVKFQRDYGDRSNRRQARLKYTIDRMGLPAVKAALEDYWGGPLEAPRPMRPFKVVDHIGWHRQGDGKWYLGLPIPSGRLVDQGDKRLRSGLRAAMTGFGLRPILTATQDIILADIAEVDRQKIQDILEEHGVETSDGVSPVRRWAMACPALPTCGLALTEAERVLPALIDRIEAALARHGLDQERLSIRMTGCPNGCARPYAGDIGLVGRVPGYYAIYVGGDFEGTRLNAKLFDRVAFDDVPPTLEPLFALFVRERKQGEGFGNFCHRKGVEALKDHLAELRGSLLAAAL